MQEISMLKPAQDWNPLQKEVKELLPKESTFIKGKQLLLELHARLHRKSVYPESNFAFTINSNAGNGRASFKAIDWITMKLVKKFFGWKWRFWL
jgi:hypothetical protein